VTVDVTAGQIPASTAIVGFQFILLHNDAALTVLNYNLAFLLGATPGSQIADVSEPTPDDWINGRWGAAAVDMGPGSYSESGSGVLARVTLGA
jgi:hypothetical protein